MRAPTPRESALLESLCGPASPSEIAALREAVARYGESLRLAARHRELLPVDLADALVANLDALLADFALLAPDAQRLAVGGARYFISDTDAIPDQSGVLGLDDDVAVWNHVARRAGRPDLEIDE